MIEAVFARTIPLAEPQKGITSPKLKEPVAPLVLQHQLFRSNLMDVGGNADGGEVLALRQDPS